MTEGVQYVAAALMTHSRKWERLSPIKIDPRTNSIFASADIGDNFPPQSLSPCVLYRRMFNARLKWVWQPEIYSSTISHSREKENEMRQSGVYGRYM